MSPKVSVIIPVYNTEQYLRRTLTSIQRQTLKDIEIICVDDSSADHSYDLIVHLSKSDSRIRVFSVEHRGAGGCRNYGLFVAQGAYIYFMDSDDYLEEEALEVCYNTAERDNLDVLLFNGVSEFLTPELGRKFWRYRSQYWRDRKYSDIVMDGKELFFRLYTRAQYFASPCLFFLSKNFLLKQEFSFETGIIYEDNISSLSWLLKAERVKLINRTFFRRMVRENSVMTVPQRERELVSYQVCINRIFKMAYEESGAVRQSLDIYLYTLIRRYLSLHKKLTLNCIPLGVSNEAHVRILTLKTKLIVNRIVLINIVLRKILRYLKAIIDS